MLRIFALSTITAVLFLLTISCTGSSIAPPSGDGDLSGQDGTGDDGEGSEPDVHINPVGNAFDAQYNEPTIRLPAAYAGPPLGLPIDLESIPFIDDFGFSDTQRAFLSSNGFIVTPSWYREFHDAYEVDYPIFVTVDSTLHVYRLVFAKILRDLEDNRFYPTIASLTSALEDSAAKHYGLLQDTDVEEAALFAWGYFAVAEQLILETPPVLEEPIKSLVEPEVANILAHEGTFLSPLLSLDQPYTADYSQYKPRGHYTRTEQRQRYFRTMMWYGRVNLRLKSELETQCALLITLLSQYAAVDDTPACELWASVYDPTVFLVGDADDLGIREYSALIAEVYGEGVEFVGLGDPALLAQFMSAARALPPPQINSMIYPPGADEIKETQGFRFMGQRFILDGWIHDSLSHSDVPGRYRVSGLDVFAGMDNAEAYAILAEEGVPAQYAMYDPQLNMIKQRIADFTTADWTQNVYFCWLYVLEGTVETKNVNYPPFMRTQSWARKDLHSVLGSWAELRHDTILYAKQPEFSLPSEPPSPRVDDLHYLEPNPMAYSRLAGLSQYTEEGLASRQLLTDAAQELLDEMVPKMDAYQLIAEKELAGETITAEDNEHLRKHGSWLKHMLWLSEDEEDEDPDYAALIADVATDPNTSMAMEVGTGKIYRIYVVTPDGQGGLQLATGGVFSYYEFWQPTDQRLTDGEWRQMLNEKTQPAQPGWTQSFIIPE